jgi:hypothetical protein
MGFMDDVRVEADKLASGNKLAIIKRKLDKQEFAEFAAALNDKTIPCSAIQRVLKSRGLVISDSTIRRYRQHNVV